MKPPPIARVARRWRVPEVLQSSQMDCGPAALKAVMEGFGIQVGYDELRERCQTDVDGTALEALASLGREYGLESQVIMVPHDHFLLPESDSLPAIVTMRSSGGLLHFVVVWRTLGPFAMVMDPASGRHWLSRAHLLRELPQFSLPVSAARWRRWASSAPARAAWHARLRRLGSSSSGARDLLTAALADPSWAQIARLDGALRMLNVLVDGGALRRGRPAREALQELLSGSGALALPPRFAWVKPAPDQAQQLLAHGGVIVRFAGGDGARTGAPPRMGRATPRSAAAAQAGERSETRTAEVPALNASRTSDALPKSVQRALEQPSWQPLMVLWKLVRSQAGGVIWLLLVALLLSSLVIPLEALLLQGLLDMNRHRTLSYEQVTWLWANLLLIAAGLCVEGWSERVATDLGRELEGRVRAAQLWKLPRLGENYLRSRPSSDMANRANGVHLARRLPTLWAQAVRSAFTVVALVAALWWLYPEGSPAILCLSGVSLVLPLLGRGRLTEKSLRLQTHTAGLERFALDALLGATALRAHGAARSMQNAHEELLSEWARTARDFHRHQSVARAAQLLGTSAAGAALVVSYVQHEDWGARLLLLAFLALRVPTAADELLAAVFALRNLKSLALRMLAPLAAPAVPVDTTSRGVARLSSAAPAPQAAASTAPARAAHIALRDVNVVAGGHSLLENVTLDIAAGQHLAIVGASGAGKSSLLGLLLGFSQPSAGSLELDGQPLDRERIFALRAQTAWVDPAIQLWNRSLLDNLFYGNDETVDAALPAVLSAADLLDALPQLSRGLQSDLGEHGSCLSGGQGQRVRIGRALLRHQPRLVLLDEPFRGLPREQRQKLLARVREHWRDATLLFVSHDVDDTAGFERVIVFESGRIVEQGAPALLLSAPRSRYAALHGSARSLDRDLWQSGIFEKLQLIDGRLSASTREPVR